jgi:hypothetical protein
MRAGLLQLLSRAAGSAAGVAGGSQGPASAQQLHHALGFAARPCSAAPHGRSTVAAAATGRRSRTARITTEAPSSSSATADQAAATQPAHSSSSGSSSSSSSGRTVRRQSTASTQAASLSGKAAALGARLRELCAAYYAGEPLVSCFRLGCLAVLLRQPVSPRDCELVAPLLCCMSKPPSPHGCHPGD